MSGSQRRRSFFAAANVFPADHVTDPENTIEIAGGQVVTSAITNEAVDSLNLTVGGDAYAVVKASDVMIAVD